MLIANINTIGPNDVLFGRGYRTNHNPGNIKFRDYCDSRRGHYKQLGNNRAKTNYCTTILQYIKSTGGRFLRFDDATKSWCEVDDDDVLIRIAQRFRMPPSKYNKIKPSSAPTPTHAVSNHRHRARGIKSIGAKDVLFGRGKQSNNNKGNIMFRNYCYARKEKYASLCKVEKTKLTRDILHNMISKGWRFLRYNKQMDAWYRVDNSEVRNKIAQFLREPLQYDSDEGIMSSFVIDGFLQKQKQPHLDEHVKNVLGNCLDYPSKEPTVPGSKGLNAKVTIGPYDPKNVAVNLDRDNTYIREEFGRDVGPGESSGGRDTLIMPCYGTGTGTITHGTSAW